MARLLGISGSLRAASFNTALLRAAEARVGSGDSLEVATLHGIPLFDEDLETREGLPAAVMALREAIQRADGLILATPEYNSGVPGVFKNALDWLSRTSRDRPSVLSGKPVALIGATPGGFGTVLAQTHWLPVLRALGMRHWTEGRLLVSKAHSVFPEGELKDAAVAMALAEFMEGFGRFVDSVH